MKFTRRMALLALAGTMLGGYPALAQTPGNATSVYVADMHCPTCARKIASRMFTVPGVVRVSTDVAKGLAVVTPQAQRTPSPRGLWEAVEKSGFKPTRIVSPLGTFDSKPDR